MSAAPRLRPAGEGDLDWAARVEAYWPHTPHWSRQALAQELGKERSVFLIAEEGGARGAYGVFWLLPPDVQVLTLACDPALLRRGLARAVLREGLERAKAAGCARACLEASEKNAAALALYRSEGFAAVGRRAGYYGDGSDAVLLDKLLEE